MKLIVGLGNPGTKYEHTRHNAGFLAVDDFLQAQISHTATRNEKFNALATDVQLFDQKITFIKPQTYMNKSGSSVQARASWLKCSVKDILVIHDEIDLATGTIQAKLGGGHAGHNGLRDIIDKLGSKDFARIRVGIGRPAHKDFVPDYVLQTFPMDEWKLVAEKFHTVHDRIEQFIQNKR